MKCCTKGCHKMVESVILKISNGETLQKWHALFRVKWNVPLFRKYKRQWPYFLVSSWDITKAMQNHGQENIDTLVWHMMYMYIHENLIPKMSEGMSNDTTKAKILENHVLATLCQDTVG